MTSEKFRYQLRQEAMKWREEGLIDPGIYEQLATKYKLNELDSASRARFVSIVLGVGFILLGLGVITFVAANWQVWSRPIKTLLLLSVFLATSLGGFYLWKSSIPGKSRLGQGVLVFASLTMGANIGLMSQMFHQTGSAYQLFLVWGIGIWAMAYGLRLTSLGFLAVILMVIAYCIGIFKDAIWNGADLGFALQQMSLIVSFLFIPLAYYCRSRWIFGLSSILIVFALGVNLAHYLDIGDISSQSFIPALVLILLPGWLWSYRDNLVFASSNIYFDSISRKLAVFYLGSFFYLCSFNFWESNFDSVESGKFIDFVPWSSLIAPTIFTLFSIWAWWRLGVRRDRKLSWRMDHNSTYVGGTLLFIFCLIWFNFAIAPISIGGTIIFNLLLFALALILISQSVKEGQRFNFWLGIVLVILQIFSRMFEYNTDLILKAIALVICGIAAIMAGLWFERNLSNQNSNSPG